MLSETTILELQKILSEEFNQNFSKSEVDGVAVSLVSLVETLIEIDNTPPCETATTE